MHIIITAATQQEYAPLLQKITEGGNPALRVDFCETGVGIMRTTFALTELIQQQKPDLILQMGIGGCFDMQMSLGSVVIVKDEILADLGVEENDQWKDVFDMGFEQSNEFPFENKMLVNRFLPDYNLIKVPEVRGITINEITTSSKRIALLKQKYNATIESMEGAGLHYVCSKLDIPYLQIRSLSNYVGERDKSKWEIKKAIESLNQITEQLISKLAN